jgi:hypothetical protein
MIQDLIDKISYEFYVKDKDNYFQDKIIPSIIYDLFMARAKPINPDPLIRCSENIAELEKNIKNGGYELDINQVLKFHPIIVHDKLDLLGEYIINTPLCMFLEVLNNDQMCIKLDGTSSNQDLNFLGNLLKEPYGFKNMVLVYDYNPEQKINFLKLSYIYDSSNNKTINPFDSNWIEFLQSGYLELFMVLTIYHALWHLMTAYITCVVKENIKSKELVQVFTMSEQNIFNKANEVKTFFLQSPLLFNTILYTNKEFMNWVELWVNNFVEQFDISTHYSKYILRGVLNPEQNWIPGFRENLELVGNLSKSIISNTPEQYHECKIWNWNGYQNVNPSNKVIKVVKLIEILYTLGSVYHSNTFDYQKFGFTELIYCKKIPENFYLVLLATLEWNEKYPIYGNYSDYEGYVYKKDLEEFHLQLEKIREQVSLMVEPNNIYKSFIYTNTDKSTEHYSINTWNTRV